MIVVDASVVLTALIDSGASGTFFRHELARDPQRHAPGLLDAEVASGIRGWLLGGHLDKRSAREAVHSLREFPVERHPDRYLIERAFSPHENLTVYDGLYVALAAALDATLVTADARLAAAPRLPCRVRLLEA